MAVATDLPPGSQTVRVYGPGDDPAGPYRWCCAVQFDGDTATATATLSAPTPDQFEAVADLARVKGYRFLRFERRTGRRPGWHVYDLESRTWSYTPAG